MNQVAVVIVTFNNPGMLETLLNDLALQSRPADEVVVVDNSGFMETAGMVRNKFINVKYYKLPENLGTSGGYYAGFRRVMEKSDGIWTLDDDVRLEKDSLKNLLQAYTSLVARYPIGAVRSVGGNHGRQDATELEIAPWRGTLWVGGMVRKIGPPRADYFIYGEDLEYSLRMRKAGYVCYWAPQSRCIEARYEKTADSMLGKPVAIYPSAFRLYYAFRSESNIFLEYRRWDKMAKLLFYGIKVLAYLLVREQAKAGTKIVAVIKGLSHGLGGKLGKNPAYLP
ncbi:MAG: glycosyltransferase [Chitinivibrionales bacterium]|nr:glycosyltransferase [Chitinivibrionales bacterium]